MINRNVYRKGHDINVRCIDRNVTAIRKWVTAQGALRPERSFFIFYFILLSSVVLPTRAYLHVGLITGYPRVFCISDLVGLLRRIF